MGTVRISYGCSYNSQGIINRPLHGALICSQCLGCPSYGAKFKKMCNCHVCGADVVVAYNTAPSHLILGHSMLFHFISYVMSYHIIWHDMYHVMLSYIMSYFLHCVICGMSSHVILYYDMWPILFRTCCNVIISQLQQMPGTL